jgi:hypothetical protein
MRKFDGQADDAIELGERPTTKIRLEANITSPSLLAIVALESAAGDLGGRWGGTAEPDVTLETTSRSYKPDANHMLN